MSIAAIRLCRKEEVAPQLSFYADQQDDGRETALLEATMACTGATAKTRW